MGTRIAKTNPSPSLTKTADLFVVNTQLGLFVFSLNAIHQHHLAVKLATICLAFKYFGVIEILEMYRILETIHLIFDKRSIVTELKNTSKVELKCHTDFTVPAAFDQSRRQRRPFSQQRYQKGPGVYQ